MKKQPKIPLARGYPRLLANARSTGRQVTITKEQYVEIRKNPCFYCNKKFNTSGGGIDRRDNFGHYTLDNSVCCCPTCNRMKSEFSMEDFIKQCKKVAKFYGKQGRNKKRI